MSLLSCKEVLKRAVLVGDLGIIVTTNMFVVHKNIGNRSLPSKAIEFLLKPVPILFAVNFMNDHLDTLHGLEELLGLLTICTVRLTPHNNLVGLVLGFDVLKRASFLAVCHLLKA